MATRTIAFLLLGILLCGLLGCDGSFFPLPPEDSYSSPDWSPDGSMIAYCFNDKGKDTGYRLAIYYVDSGSSYTFSTTAENTVDWFSDSDRLLICNDDGQHVYSIDSNERVKVHDYRTFHAVISPDGTQVLYDGEDRMICLYSLLDGTEKIIVEGLFPSWTPDGNSFAYIDPGDTDLYLYHLATEEITRYRLDEYYMNLSLSNSGEHAAFDLKENGIYSFDLASQEVKELTEFGAKPSWSTDDTKIAFVGTYSGIYTVDVETKEVQQLIP